MRGAAYERMEKGVWFVSRYDLSVSFNFILCTKLDLFTLVLKKI